MKEAAGVTVCGDGDGGVEDGGGEGAAVIDGGGKGVAEGHGGEDDGGPEGVEEGRGGRRRRRPWRIPYRIPVGHLMIGGGEGVLREWGGG